MILEIALSIILARLLFAIIVVIGAALFAICSSIKDGIAILPWWIPTTAIVVGGALLLPHH